MVEKPHRLIEERIKKCDRFIESGVTPYPHTFNKSNIISDVKSEFSSLKQGDKSDKVVSIAGRIMRMRVMGKALFCNIKDESGNLQVYASKDDLSDDYKILKKLDIGDFIGVSGCLFITKTGELSVHANSFSLLCKSLRPLPEKFHGVTDTEIKYRKRYLDLIMNDDSKEIFKKRFLILEAIREFMKSRGFLEVETPILHPLYGGAAARPFMTHHNDLDMDLYLRISPELYLKRLLVGGFEKVFDINKNFRNEGIDTTHNPEFTMLEAYQAYADYNDMMDLMESMYDFVAKKVLGSTKFSFKGTTVDVAKPWKRISMIDAITKYAGFDVSNMSVDDLYDEVNKAGIDFDKKKTWGFLVASLFEHFCEDKFVNPTFVIDHPRETTPLCKGLRSGDSRLIERFEPFCLGMELGNAYSELNDPRLQRELLEDQQKQLSSGDLEANPLDEDFIEAIETGMPPAGGIGVGIDRMIMLLLGCDSIRDILLFPTMKNIVEDDL